MCLRFQRFQETSHFCGDELRAGERGVNAERLAQMIRQDASQQGCFDRGLRV